MDFFAQMKTYPKGGNLFGMPEAVGGDNFNSIIASESIEVNIPNTATVVYPISVPFTDFSQLDIIYTSNDNKDIGQIVFIPDNDVNSSYFRANCNISVNPVNKTISITNTSTSNLGVIRIIVRRRKLKNKYISPLVASSSAGTLDLPFSIKDPRKAWIDKWPNSGSTLQGTFIVDYLPFAQFPNAKHTANASNIQFTTKVINASQVYYSTTSQFQFVLLEFY